MARIVRAVEAVLRLMLFVGLIFTPLMSAAAPARAQAASSSPWVVRAIPTSGFGVNAPKGLAYSPSAKTFLILDGTSLISLMKMSEDAAGILTLPDVQADPLNVTFDQTSGGLYVFNRSKAELVKLAADGTGLPRAVGQKRFAGQALGIGDAQGITFDPANGTLFVLDSGKSQILSVVPSASLGFDGAEAVRTGKVGRISLKKLDSGSLRGIAFNPGNGHLYVADPAQKNLYELDLQGNLIATFGLGSLGISASASMIFAPSADNTDEPGIHNLFILDAGTPGVASRSGLAARSVSAQQTTTGSAQIVEVSLVTAAAVPPGTPMLPASLVQTFATSNVVWNPSAPDPAGIAYWPLTGRLFIIDSEVDEMPNYFQGKNVYLSTLSGTLMSTCSTTSFTLEPTGAAINPNNNHIFISQDGANGKLFEISLGPDGTYCTADDTVTTTNVASLYGIADAEDVAYGDNTLYVAGGVDAEVYIIPLGANGVLGGGDDGPVTQFDTLALGFTDLEGIAYNPDTGTLFLVSPKGTERYIGETTTSGALLRAYDVAFMGSGPNKRSGITFAPGTQNPAVKNVYIVSRNVDNNVDPNENDGAVWEINFFGSGTPGPSATPTKTNTPGPTPTSTRTPTVTPTTSPFNTVCLPPVQDSYLVQDKPTQNHGAEADLKVKPDSGKERRILIRFDLASIPSNGTVLGSILRIYEDTKVSGQTTSLYRLTNSWNESQVTWNSRVSGSSWTTAGGDYNTTALATFSPNVDKVNREINITGVTQSWMNGGFANHGVLLRSAGSNGEVKFKSKEVADPAKRPELCVTYQLPSTLTPVPTSTRTFTSTPAATATHTSTSTAVATNTPAATPTAVFTGTPAATASASPVPGTPTDTPLPTFTPTQSPLPDLIFADGFESGNFSAWSANKTGGGDLSVSAAAALVGSLGMQALINDTTTLYVTDERPDAEPRYRARFYFDPNSITMANLDTHVIFNGFSGTVTTTGVLRVEFRSSAGAYQLRVRSFTDASSWTNSLWFTISDDPHVIEIDWRGASAPGTNDGGLTFWIDGVQQADLIGIDNDTRRIDSVRLGAVVELDAGTLGTYYFDAFESRRQTYIGP